MGKIDLSQRTRGGELPELEQLEPRMEQPHSILGQLEHTF